MKRYLVVIEKAQSNYSAYAPDLPGCVTTGATIDETLQNMQEAISLHLETMAELGIPIPEPTTTPESLLGVSHETRVVEIAA